MRQLVLFLTSFFCLAQCVVDLRACTTAVISGRATFDGRPLLWKNRDNSSQPHNEVAVFTEGRYRAVAVVNAASRRSVWMGVNEAGFCIENSLSRDLASDSTKGGPGNGAFMKLALESCATVDDFRELLEATNQSGRSTTANFGVIDAEGGAAMFESGRSTFQMLDANDPAVAPDGILVRANFATTAHALEPMPKSKALTGIYSSGRYLRACKLLQNRPEGKVDLKFLLRNLTRDLSDASGVAYQGTINGGNGSLPKVIPTADTLSRTTTVSAVVFHGVRPDEDPQWTTMWTILGDPKYSLAVPIWPHCESIADPLADERGGELGEIALTLRDWTLTLGRDSIRTETLPGIWQDLWPLEEAFLARVETTRGFIGKQPWSASSATILHQELAELAFLAMQNELQETKEFILASPIAKVDTYSDEVKSGLVRVAVYDHSGGDANGPKNLARILTERKGFSTQRVTPQEIREHALAGFDVLIMPGGSGSGQSKRLEESGRKNILEFVQQGGGYVGICAGAYLASSQYTWSLNLINAKVWDRAHWARGTGDVCLSFSPDGQELFGSVSSGGNTEPIDVYYGQGPLLVPGENPSLPPYELLAAFETEIAKKGAPTEAMTKTHAVIRSTFGEGRVLCFVPHPERSGGPNHLITTGVRWAAKPDSTHR